jgi:hypothetical protein
VQQPQALVEHVHSTSNGEGSPFFGWRRRTFAISMYQSQNSPQRNS